MPLDRFNFLDFLEEVPEAPFFATVAPFARTPGRERFFGSDFAPIRQQFLGTLGQQIQGGQLPTARFQDFLNNQDLFNPNRRFLQTPRAFRPGGDPASRLAPRAQFFGFN